MTCPTHKQRIANPSFLDYSESQISPTYAACLANQMRDWNGPPYNPVGYRSPRPHRILLKTDYKDNNAFHHQASIPTSEHSPRGFRTEEWTLHSKTSLNYKKSSVERGTFKRRPFPPKERKFFPSLIREDKEKQVWLEKKRNKQTAIVVLQIQQEENWRAIQDAVRAHEAVEREERSKESVRRMKRVERRNEVLEMADNAKRMIEQVLIQHEIDVLVEEFQVFDVGQDEWEFGDVFN